MGGGERKERKSRDFIFPPIALSAHTVLTCPLSAMWALIFALLAAGALGERVWTQYGGDFQKTGRSAYAAPTKPQLMWQRTLDAAVTTPALVTVADWLAVVTKDGSYIFLNQTDGTNDPLYYYRGTSQSDRLSIATPPISLPNSRDDGESAYTVFFSDGIINTNPTGTYLGTVGLPISSISTTHSFRAPPTFDGYFVHAPTDDGFVYMGDKAASDKLFVATENNPLTSVAVKLVFPDSSNYNQLTPQEIEETGWSPSSGFSSYTFYVCALGTSLYNLHAYKLGSNNEFEELWSSTEETVGSATCRRNPVFVASHNYVLAVLIEFFNGTSYSYVSAFDADTGEYIYSTSPYFGTYSPLALGINNDFILASNAGSNTGIDWYSLETGDYIAFTLIGVATIISAPVVDSRGTVVVGDLAGILYAFSSETHKLLWQIQTDGPIVTSVVIGPHALYVGSRSVYAFTDCGFGEVWSPVDGACKGCLNGSTYSSPTDLSCKPCSPGTSTRGTTTSPVAFVCDTKQEGGTLILSSPYNQPFTQVLSAYFGVIEGDCSSLAYGTDDLNNDDYYDAYSYCAIDSSVVLDYASKQCLGVSSCTLAVDSSIFGNAPCPQWYYYLTVSLLSSEGNVGCFSCDAGFYQPSSGATSCTPCPAGTWSPDVGATTCKNLCAAGTFSTTPRGKDNSVCESCPPGSYQLLEGQTSCVSLPAGYYSPNSSVSFFALGETSDDFFMCPPGTGTAIRGLTDESQCTPCTAGSYQPEPGQSTCKPCAAGTANPHSHSSAPEDCAPCAEGSFSPDTAQASCDTCPPGSEGKGGADNKTELGSCSLCAAGRYQPKFGQPRGSCKQCQPGTWSSAGAAACEMCAKSTYSIFPGAISAASCAPCPNGTSTSSFGSSSPTDCSPADFVCPAGFQIDAFTATATAAGTCKPLVCDPPLALSPGPPPACVNCPQNQYRNALGACAPCPPEQTCLGILSSPVFTFAPSSAAISASRARRASLPHAPCFSWTSAIPPSAAPSSTTEGTLTSYASSSAPPVASSTALDPAPLAIVSLGVAVAFALFFVFILAHLFASRPLSQSVLQ